MRFALLSSACLAAFTATALADQLTYTQAGQVAPATTLTATNTGEVIGYFYGSAAGGTDYVRLVDLTTGFASPFLLDNHATSIGQSVSFGRVTAGDTLIFELVNSDVETSVGYTDFTNLGPIDPNARQNQYLMATDPAYSVDGINHGYVSAFSGDAALGIPAGTYIGMEDLPGRFADLDYNDTEFVFTDLTAVAPTPEPASLALLGTGALAIFPALRRRGQNPQRSAELDS